MDKKQVYVKGMAVSTVPKIKYDTWFKLFGLVTIGLDVQDSKVGAVKTSTAGSSVRGIYRGTVCALLWFIAIRSLILMAPWPRWVRRVLELTLFPDHFPASTKFCSVTWQVTGTITDSTTWCRWPFTHFTPRSRSRSSRRRSVTWPGWFRSCPWNSFSPLRRVWPPSIRPITRNGSTLPSWWTWPSWQPWQPVDPSIITEPWSSTSRTTCSGTGCHGSWSTVCGSFLFRASKCSPWRTSTWFRCVWPKGSGSFVGTSKHWLKPVTMATLEARTTLWRNFTSNTTRWRDRRRYQK